MHSCLSYCHQTSLIKTILAVRHFIHLMCVLLFGFIGADEVKLRHRNTETTDGIHPWTISPSVLCAIEGKAEGFVTEIHHYLLVQL